MNNTASEDFYLVLKPRGYSGLSGRITRMAPALSADEIAMTLRVEVPKALFSKPVLKATVTIPKDKVTPSQVDAVVLDNVRQALEQQTGLAVQVALVERENAE